MDCPRKNRVSARNPIPHVVRNVHVVQSPEIGIWVFVVPPIRVWNWRMIGTLVSQLLDILLLHRGEHPYLLHPRSPYRRRPLAGLDGVRFRHNQTIVVHKKDSANA